MASMTITEQVEVIRSATKDAAKSKESALQFLKDAGIIKGKQSVNLTSKPTTHKSLKK